MWHIMILFESRKPLVWLHGEIKSPPFSPLARIEAGDLLRRLQCGENLEFPDSRPMPVIGRRCHELRIQDLTIGWRVIYRVDHDAVVVAAIFAKKTRATPETVIDVCQRRLRAYDEAAQEWDS